MGKYDNLNQIKYEFLQTVASSLKGQGSQQVMQWQEIATALINEVMEWKYTPLQYIYHIYPKWLDKYSTKFIDNFTQFILKNKPEITNPYLVTAILWTLSSIHSTYANHWLAGLELTQQRAEEMGLPNFDKDDKEAEGLRTVRQILDIVSNYKVPVICFDELDIADANDNGFLSAQVVASLAKDLYNSLKQGILLLAMYPQTWNEQIKVLPQAEAVIDRLVSEQLDRKPLKLNNPNADDIVKIVSQWLQVFYEENQEIPPNPLYPFKENKLREFGKSRPTIRSVLKWCAENFIPPQQIEQTTKKDTSNKKLEEYFVKELANVKSSIDKLMEDNEAISNALKLAFSTLIGEKLEGVSIEAVEDVKRRGIGKVYIDFKVIGNDRKVKIGVDVIQESNGQQIGAALKRLIDYEKFDITRGCLVRSKEINSKAAVPKKCLKQLLHYQGGEWVKLQSEDIKELLAIWFVHSSKTYKVSQEEVFEFIKQKLIAINNPLVREILSEPSREQPTNLNSNIFPISIPQSVESSADSINDLNNLPIPD